jgi:hypothetical protein
MKPCLICHAANADDAVTCVACGEGSFAPAVKAEPAKPAREPEPEGVTLPASGRPSRGRR